jgi:phage terminase small subunit
MPRLATEQEEAFAHHYVDSFNETDAARAAGLGRDQTTTNAKTYGNLMMLRPDVQRRVRELNDAKMRKIDASVDRTMREISHVAFADIRRLFDEDGKLIAVHLLPDEVAAAISSIKIDRRRVKNGYETDLVTGKRVPIYEDIETVEIKRHDKMAALTILAKHFKIVGSEEDGVNALASALADKLDRAKQRVFDNSGAEDAQPPRRNTPELLDAGVSTPVPQSGDGDRADHLGQ